MGGAGTGCAIATMYAWSLQRAI